MKRTQLGELQEIQNLMNARPAQQIQCQIASKRIEFISVGRSSTIEFTLKRTPAQRQLPGCGLQANITTSETICNNFSHVAQEVIV